MTDYICILDFEATCWKDTKNHEIIEFPSVMLKWDDDKIYEVGRIQQYVKPKTKPVVSKFCEELTGITQQIVNDGMELKLAIKGHLEWLSKFSNNSNITIVTCGNWDLNVMLPMDLKNIGRKSETIYKKFVNIKDLFGTVTKTTKGPPMVPMLEYYDLELEGRHHSGLDDCHNIARIFIKLVENGLTKSMFLEHMRIVDDEDVHIQKKKQMKDLKKF
jgi:ERI1 exoribonuclease 3